MKLSELQTVKKLNSKTLNFIVGGTSFSEMDKIADDSQRKDVSSTSHDSYKKDR